jgi:hypothetical protein
MQELPESTRFLPAPHVLRRQCLAEAQRQIASRDVPSKDHVIKGITHYGIYRKGSLEASTLAIAWIEGPLKWALAK